MTPYDVPGPADESSDAPRFVVPGSTDFAGVMLPAIVSWLAGMAEMLTTAQDGLVGLTQRLQAEPEWLHAHVSAKHLLNNCLDRFGRVRVELLRLAGELPSGVVPGHVQLLEQTHHGLRTLTDADCVAFKEEYEAQRLRDETRWLFDNVYASCRRPLWDLLDINNVTERLRTFVGVAPEHLWPVGAEGTRAAAGETEPERKAPAAVKHHQPDDPMTAKACCAEYYSQSAKGERILKGAFARTVGRCDESTFRRWRKWYPHEVWVREGCPSKSQILNEGMG